MILSFVTDKTAPEKKPRGRPRRTPAVPPLPSHEKPQAVSRSPDKASGKVNGSPERPLVSGQKRRGRPPRSAQSGNAGAGEHQGGGRPGKRGWVCGQNVPEGDRERQWGTPMDRRFHRTKVKLKSSLRAVGRKGVAIPVAPRRRRGRPPSAERLRAAVPSASGHSGPSMGVGPKQKALGDLDLPTPQHLKLRTTQTTDEVTDSASNSSPAPAALRRFLGVRQSPRHVKPACMVPPARRSDAAIAKQLLQRAKKGVAVRGCPGGPGRDRAMRRRWTQLKNIRQFRMPVVSTISMRVIKTPKRFMEDEMGFRAPPPHAKMARLDAAPSASLPLPTSPASAIPGASAPAGAAACIAGVAPPPAGSTVSSTASQHSSRSSSPSLDSSSEAQSPPPPVRPPPPGSERGRTVTFGRGRRGRRRCFISPATGLLRSSSSQQVSPSASSSSLPPPPLLAPPHTLRATSPTSAVGERRPHHHPAWVMPHPMAPFLPPPPVLSPLQDHQRSILRQPTFRWTSAVAPRQCFSSAKYAKEGLIRKPVFDNFQPPPLTAQDVGLLPPCAGVGAGSTFTAPNRGTAIGGFYPPLPHHHLQPSSRFGVPLHKLRPPLHKVRPLLRAPRFTPSEAHSRIFESVTIPRPRAASLSELRAQSLIGQGARRRRRGQLRTPSHSMTTRSSQSGAPAGKGPLQPGNSVVSPLPTRALTPASFSTFITRPTSLPTEPTIHRPSSSSSSSTLLMFASSLAAAGRGQGLGGKEKAPLSPQETLVKEKDTEEQNVEENKREIEKECERRGMAVASAGISGVALSPLIAGGNDTEEPPLCSTPKNPNIAEGLPAIGPGHEAVADLSPACPTLRSPAPTLDPALAPEGRQQVTGLLKKAKAQLCKMEKGRSVKTTEPPKAQDFVDMPGRGPRIKHVCRRAAVALGRNRAVFPDDLPTLSALPWEERENILSSIGNDDKSSVAGSEEAEAPVALARPAMRPRVLPDSPARAGRRSRRCGQCAGCQVPDDCGVCANCLDKPKFGGRNIKKQCCKERKCQNLQWMPAKMFLQKPGKAKKDKKEKQMFDKKEQPVKSPPSEGDPNLALKEEPAHSETPPQPQPPPSAPDPATALEPKQRAAPLQQAPPPQSQPPAQPNQTPPQKGSATSPPSEPKEEKQTPPSRSLNWLSTPSTGGAAAPSDGARGLRGDFREDGDVEKVWRAGGLSILASVPHRPLTLCLLCASSGDLEFVFCQVCCEPFHLFCLGEAERPLQQQRENWCCRRCRFCQACGQQDHRSKQQLLECEKCGNSYHPECLGPKHPRRPTKKNRVWICTRCVCCKSCGSTSPGKAADAQWSHDFSLCQDCAKLFVKGNFCPLCDKCYDDDDYESKMMQCGRCARWVHARCENLTDEMYEILSKLPESVVYTCTSCTQRPPAEWRTALEKELQSSLRRVLTALLNSRTSAHLLHCSTAVMKLPELNPESKESLPSLCSPVGPDPPLLRDVAPSKSPPDLESVKRKMESGGYSSVLDFSDDVVKIIQTAISCDGGQPENKKANSMVKAFFSRQMERVFPWFLVKESRFWQPDKVSPSSELLPDAVLPPSLDHNYAQCQERDGTSPTEQSLLMKKIIPAPQPQGLGEPEPPTTPSPAPPQHLQDFAQGDSPEVVVPPGLSDSRQCVLCLKYGDDNNNDGGRLLYIGQNEWTHVNCALWSAEVFEDDDGTLKNVHTAVAHGKQLRCELCKRSGATMCCCVSGCSSKFHFMCARRQHCVFLEDKRMYCSRHHNLIKGEVVSESGFGVTRRILVDFEGINLRRKFLSGVDPESVQIMIGSMTVDCLGTLTELSDFEHHLFPIGYQCSRVYWSTVDARRRCVYTFRILACGPLLVDPVSGSVSTISSEPPWSLEGTAEDATWRGSSSLLVFSSTSTSPDSSESESAHHLPAHHCEDDKDGPEEGEEDGSAADDNHEDDSDESGSAKRRYPRRSARARSNMFFGLTPFYGVRSYGEEDVTFHCHGETCEQKPAGGRSGELSAEEQVDRTNNMSSSSSEGSEEDEESIGESPKKDAFYYNFTRTILSPGVEQTVGRMPELHSFLKKEAGAKETKREEAGGSGKSSGQPRISQLDGVDDGSESDASLSAAGMNATSTTSTSKKSARKRKAKEGRVEKQDGSGSSGNSGGRGNNGGRSRSRKSPKESSLSLGSGKSQGQGSLDAQLSLSTDLLKSDSDNTNSDDCGNILPSDIMEFVLNTPSMQALDQQPESSSSQLLSLDEGFSLDGNRGKDMSLFEDFPQQLPSTTSAERGASVSGDEPYLPLELPSDLSVLTTRSSSVTSQNPQPDQPEPTSHPIISLPTDDSTVEKVSNKQTGGNNENQQSGLGSGDPPAVEGSITSSHIDANLITSPSSGEVLESASHEVTGTSGTSGLQGLQKQKYVPATTGSSGSAQVASTAVQPTHLKPGTENVIVVNQHLQPLYVLQTCPGVTQKIQIAPSVTTAAVIDTRSSLISSMTGGLTLTAGLHTGIPAPQSMFPPGSKGPIPISHHPQIHTFTGTAQTACQSMPSTSSSLLIGVHHNDPRILVSEAGQHPGLAPNSAIVSCSSSLPSSTQNKKRPISRLQPRRSRKLARSQNQPSNMTLINLSPMQITAGIPAQSERVELGTLTSAAAAPHRKVPNIIKRPKSGVMYFEPQTLLSHGVSVSGAQPVVLGHEPPAQLLPCTVSGLNPNQPLLNVLSVPAGSAGSLISTSALSTPISGLLLKASQQSVGLPDHQMILQPGASIIPQLSNTTQTPVASSICVLPPTQLPPRQTLSIPAARHGAQQLQPANKLQPAADHSTTTQRSVLLSPDRVSSQGSQTKDISWATDQQQACKTVTAAGAAPLSGKGRQKGKRTRHSSDEAGGKKRKTCPADHPSEQPGEPNQGSCSSSTSGWRDPVALDAMDTEKPKEREVKRGKMLQKNPKSTALGPRKEERAQSSSSERRLLFEICSDDGFQVRCETIEEAWKSLTDKVQEARSHVNLKELCFQGANGLRMLGLVHDAVIYFVEQLRGAQYCRNHRFRFHKPAGMGDLPVNPHGSARVEQHHRKSLVDMFNFLASKHRHPPPYQHQEEEAHPKSARWAKLSNVDLPLPMRLRRLKKASRKALGVYRSAIHGRGLFCRRNIEAGEMVIEYSGTVIRSVLAEKRQRYYEGKGIGSYMFRIDDYEVVDATMHGNAARFINHSCEPNCFSRVINIQGHKRIIIFALRNIYRGEEITYDYKFPTEAPGHKLPCNCGAKTCRKFLN
ncbi:histone-lysine N-methyltransferase 2A [Conger conger]|uniref:histone-lysine N-methyltransferase 2A n=1 Tax=Conger conger TaxID=82655 RepID=UPI002A59CF5F|nr:histone-lysine N-methyltransferase 2A [Conger conger]